MTTQQEGKNDIIADENTPFAKAAVRDVRTIIIYIVVTFPSAGCPRPVGRPFYNIFILFFPLRSIAVVLFCLTVSFFFFCPPLRYGITCIDNTPIQKYSRPPVVTLLLLSTLAVAIVHRADVFSSSSSNNNKTIHTTVSVPRVGFDKAVATVAVATVTSDDISCATEVPGEGPYCDGGSIGYCTQVCDYLLTCDDGYVPEPFYLTDDEATWFPETSDYQPHSCHCRGYEDHNGCFCRQLRDMIEHSVKGAFVGECDPCLPPPTPSPTHSPTARTAYIPLRDLCFEDKDNYGKYCWYPAGNFPDPIFRYPFGNWKLSDGRSYYDCGPKCSKVQTYDPDQDDCFSDNLNYDKYCWYGSGDGIPVPVGQWTRVTGRAYHDSCGLQCEDVMDIGG